MLNAQQVKSEKKALKKYFIFIFIFFLLKKEINFYLLFIQHFEECFIRLKILRL